MNSNAGSVVPNRKKVMGVLIVGVLMGALVNFAKPNVNSFNTKCIKIKFYNLTSSLRFFVFSTYPYSH